MYKEIVSFIKALYSTDDHIPLHAPVFLGNEKTFINDCIDSTYVSTVGEYVNRFEEMVCQYTGAKYAVATTNGTAALHLSLMLMKVTPDTEVLTQALTFVATANAISYAGASPVFIDSADDNLGMCPKSLAIFLQECAEVTELGTINKITKKRISACIPMHVFGHLVDIEAIKLICQKYSIPLIEDAAESLGTFYKERHSGLFGDLGVLSFNGNKIITTGGGGMIITNDEQVAKRAKHLSTTAKRPHQWEFFHDEIGYNYRLPNINAALGCAQMERLSFFVEAKREVASEYKNFFSRLGIKFIEESPYSKSNYWLNAIQFEDPKERDSFLEFSNSHGVMTRPVWRLMPELPAFNHCYKAPLTNAKRYEQTVVNLPSSVRIRRGL